ncbi:FKBP12-interacting protein of 37 kDa isoform X1 [Raphanus sativus]|uniref:FKBP12-interacting protein of 37 kDa isoform X1 n=1 Tax=Raphanus sativus TaxID=3726 RepID=A0A6J0N7T3_RAPSA|nr:FKBP12-interacting protein of 37 kDa isoform X1 [Raphanus sativus]
MDGDHSASNATRVSGNKRKFGDHEHDVSVSKKSCTECVAIVSSTIESLVVFKDELASIRTLLSGSFDKLKDELASLFFDSFQSVKDELASCQNELDKWKSAFKKESFVPARKSPEPQHVIDYIQTLRSSDKYLKEELEIAQMKLAIRDLKAQLKPESEKLTDGDTEVHDEQQQQGSTPSGPSRNVAYLEEELRAANARIAELNEYQEVELKEMVKQLEYYRNLGKLILDKFPDLVPPQPAPEDNNDQR